LAAISFDERPGLAPNRSVAWQRDRCGVSTRYGPGNLVLSVKTPANSSLMRIVKWRKSIAAPGARRCAAQSSLIQSTSSARATIERRQAQSPIQMADDPRPQRRRTSGDFAAHILSAVIGDSMAARFYCALVDTTRSPKEARLRILIHTKVAAVLLASPPTPPAPKRR